MLIQAEIKALLEAARKRMSALQECTLARLYTEKKAAAEDCIVSRVLLHSQMKNRIMTLP